MLSNEDEESPLAKVASIIGDVFDVVNSEKKDELFDAGNPTETITTRISRTDVWDALSEFAIPHIHYSCEEIFAGKVGLLNIDFISGQGQTSSLKTVRSVIASWYKILRLIATVLFLSVLIYTGIKIMISSTAKDKAKYKEWIINWIVGFAILYFLHYLMSFIIVVISKFNTMLSNSMQYVNVSVKGNVSSFSFNTNLIGLVRFCVQSDNLLFRTGYLILYTMLTVYTFKFTMIYLKRLINMAFLTLIAPIVAFTYPIDKMADGQAQGFDMWVKEYIFNALLQPMHFLLYYVLVGSAVRISGTNPLYAIAVLAFMPEGERLLKKIFGFDKAGGGTVKGMQDAIAGAAIASSLKGMLGKGPKGGPDASKMQSPGALIKDFKDDKLSAAGAELGVAGAAGATAGAAAAQAHEDEHDHDDPPPPPPPPEFPPPEKPPHEPPTPPNSVRLFKYSDEGRGLVGAKFQLLDEDGNVVKTRAFTMDPKGTEEVFETDKNGFIVIRDLEPGVYFFKEVEAPKGYEIVNEKSQFVIFEGQAAKLSVLNKKKLGSYNFYKTNEKRNVGLGGAEFVITQKVHGKDQRVQRDGKDLVLKSGDDGKFFVRDLPYGTYEIWETKAPDGYTLLQGSLKFEINDNSFEKVLIIENTTKPPIPKTGDITLIVLVIAGAIMIGLGRFMIKDKN